MRTLQGVVRNVRSWAISEKNGSVTFHKTRYNFLLDDRPVEFTSYSSPSINEGDRLRVAGLERPEGLMAYAFKNVTNGSHGSAGSGLRSLAGMALLGLCALAILVMIAAPRSAIVMAIVPIFLLPLGLWLYLPERRAQQALTLCLVN